MSRPDVDQIEQRLRETFTPTRWSSNWPHKARPTRRNCAPPSRKN